MLRGVVALPSRATGASTAGCAMLAVDALALATTTVSPVRVSPKSFSAKACGRRMQPWEAG